jgi:hypothetical protein
LVAAADSKFGPRPRPSEFARSKMRGFKKTRSFRQFGQLRAKARPVTHPYLPFAGRCLDSYAAWIGTGLFDAATAKAAWAKFN